HHTTAGWLAHSLTDGLVGVVPSTSSFCCVLSLQLAVVCQSHPISISTMVSMFNKLRWLYIRNNLQSVLFTTLYTVASLALFVARFYQYLDTNLALALARASAMVIYFQSGMILLLVCRKSITFLRSIGMAHYLPLDHYVYFHKMTGWSIAFCSLLH